MRKGHGNIRDTQGGCAPRAARIFRYLPVLSLLCLPPCPRAGTEISGTDQEAMLAHYRDGSGETVWSGEAKSAFLIRERWRLGVKALGEWVTPGPGRENDTLNPGAGHHHGAARIAMPSLGSGQAATAASQADAVTGASSRVTTDPDGHGRMEGALSLQRGLGSDIPAFVGGVLRYSGETDFHSVLTGFNGGVELFQRNLAVAGNAGVGCDYADPKQPPPGEAYRWPALSTRVQAGIQIGQLLTPRSRLGFSYAYSALMGPQESPYRRALVQTTLFPERLPSARFRHVAGLEVGLYLGSGVALFHREGLYFDSWGVQSLIPETALPMELGQRWLVTPRHRWYSQSPARFYRTVYPGLDGKWLSGDPRLSRLEGRDLGLDLEYALGPGDRAASFSLTLTHSQWNDRIAASRDHSMTIALLFRRPG